MNNCPLFWRGGTSTGRQQHYYLLPSPCCRILIIGESGCGKTSLLLRMLLQRSWLNYNSLYVFGKSLHQPEYQLLKAGFDKGYTKSEIIDLFTHGTGDIGSYIRQLSTKKRLKTIKVQYFNDAELIPDPAEVDVCKNNIFVFDDIMTDRNQSKAEDFYTRGRHNNISSIYISQNYYKLPRQTIRSNANVLILFSLPKKDLQHIYDDIVSRDMSWTEFQTFCNKTWIYPYTYIVINKNLSKSEGRYQTNFNCVYIPTE